MRQRTNQILFDYWNKVRGARIAPRRFEIEPARIAAVLPETFILERMNRQTIGFRLAGTRVCEDFGRELRGVNFLDLIAADDRFIIEDRLGVVAEHGAVGLFEFETTCGGGSGRTEILVLPLTDPREVVTRILGSMSSPNTQSWPGQPMALKSLLRNELIWPEGRPHAVIERARIRPAFRPVTPTSRVVRSNDREFRVFDGGRSDDGARDR